MTAPADRPAAAHPSAGTAQAAWEALWACPVCGTQRKGFHY